MELTGISPGADIVSAYSHVVEFYDTEAFLADTVCAYLAPALRDHAAVVVVATAPHLRAFADAIGAAGIDLDAAVHEGRYLAFDAEAVLRQFMGDGGPDPALFRHAIGAVMDAATAGGRPVRVYGEMVTLLWADGDVAGALAVEDLWNDLAERRSFELLCSYPMRAFGREDSADAFDDICSQHSQVIPSEGYSLLSDPSARSRAVARLQQQATALQCEVLRLRAQQERDDAAAQRDHDADLVDQTVALRDQEAHRRDQVATAQDSAAAHRDVAADQRDSAADEEDRAAEARDQLAERLALAARPWREAELPDRLAMVRQEAAADRRRAARDRQAALADRIDALADRDAAVVARRAGAADRAEAGRSRARAAAYRRDSADERALASRDDLTGAYLRGPGLVRLEREMARARHDGLPFALAFVDVDRLKVINDSFGHAAGDRMLAQVATTITAKLRADDLVIRYGGDEFVCAAPALTMADAAIRLAQVNGALAEIPGCGTVTVGVAELRDDDSVEQLIARADAALYRGRRKRRVRAPDLVDQLEIR